MIKECITCHIIKNETEFKKGRNQCSDCSKLYFRNRYLNNKEKISQNQKQYYIENKDKFQERNKQYYQNNKEKINEQNKIYNENNKEKLALKSKEYRDRNQDSIKEKNKIYYIENKNKIKEYTEQNKEKISERHKSYYYNNKEKIKEKHNEYIENNKDKVKAKQKEYREKNKDELNRKSKIYKQNNKDKVKQYRVNRLAKIKTDASLRLHKNVSSKILKNLKKYGGSKCNKKSLNFLPFNSWAELKDHLESLFEFWMNWENYGQYDPNIWDDNNPKTWTWQIDHIIPCSDVPYDSMEHPNFKKCWNLDNLRPYSSKQNLLDGVNRVRHKQERN